MVLKEDPLPSAPAMCHLTPGMSTCSRPGAAVPHPDAAVCCTKPFTCLCALRSWTPISLSTSGHPALVPAAGTVQGWGSGRHCSPFTGFIGLLVKSCKRPSLREETQHSSRVRHLGRPTVFKLEHAPSLWPCEEFFPSRVFNSSGRRIPQSRLIPVTGTPWQGAPLLAYMGTWESM